ncbi:hypothetical protein GCU60_14775 [Blastococcus saxobsidens]|uniref:Uncharacterized protein n=1 Tax=Blastococcus saxobsidens TaxID=138336 RepID=A0A6L9W4L2_9ACTN|nr:hypothetical protein [Blastococcus saxobsidens]NEK87005.1 hypothetical protein [Blastococcus saxobsidens]
MPAPRVAVVRVVESEVLPTPPCCAFPWRCGGTVDSAFSSRIPLDEVLVRREGAGAVAA